MNSTKPNASIPNIIAGFKSVLQYADRRGRNMHLFPNGQIRREIGEGHSQFERQLRRTLWLKDLHTRRLYKRERRSEALNSKTA